LRFGFANVRINNRDLKVSFKPGFGDSLNNKEFEGKVLLDFINYLDEEK
jgi:hypothetical protein